MSEHFIRWVRAKFFKIAEANPDKVELLRELRQTLKLEVDIDHELNEYYESNKTARWHYRVF